MKQGKLFYNTSNDRIDIAFDDSTTHGGLHCGTCLQILQNNKWIHTRIEYSYTAEEWYLVGCYSAGKIPCGLIVKI